LKNEGKYKGEECSMSKKDIIRKLTSRKLWLSVASFVSMLCIAFGRTESEAAQVSALIIAGATVIAYVVGEGLIDYASVEDKEGDEWHIPPSSS
jgi:hypothetical protein